MTKYTEKTYILLTTLSKIFDSQIFDIHRDTIAKLLHTDNRIVIQIEHFNALESKFN